MYVCVNVRLHGKRTMDLQDLGLFVRRRLSFVGSILSFPQSVVIPVGADPPRRRVLEMDGRTNGQTVDPVDGRTSAG